MYHTDLHGILLSCLEGCSYLLLTYIRETTETNLRDCWSFTLLGMSLAKVISIGITLVGVHLNWLNWFHFLILMAGLFVILRECMILLSAFLDVTKISISTVSSSYSYTLEFFACRILSYAVSGFLESIGTFFSFGFFLISSPSFFSRFSCYSMPRSGWSALYGVKLIIMYYNLVKVSVFSLVAVKISKIETCQGDWRPEMENWKRSHFSGLCRRLNKYNKD